jgi:hypothetical protein
MWQDFSDMSQLYSTSLTLLDHCLISRPTVELQHKFLGTVPRSFASDAAFDATEVGQLETAVELLEQGRTILWSKMQDYRHPLEDLYKTNHELADRFQSLSRQLECLAMSFESEASPIGSMVEGLGIQVPSDVKMQRHRILPEEWNEVVGRIQQIDGFTDFLSAVPFATLQSAFIVQML